MNEIDLKTIQCGVDVCVNILLENAKYKQKNNV